MKMTVILDTKGELVAAQVGSAADRGREAGLVAGPDQKMHEVEVPDDAINVADATQFAAHIRPHLPRA